MKGSIKSLAITALLFYAPSPLLAGGYEPHNYANDFLNGYQQMQQIRSQQREDERRDEMLRQEQERISLERERQKIENEKLAQLKKKEELDETAKWIESQLDIFVADHKEYQPNYINILDEALKIYDNEDFGKLTLLDSLYLAHFQRYKKFNCIK